MSLKERTSQLVRGDNLFVFFATFSLTLALFKIVFHLKFFYLPIAFFLLGLVSYLLKPKKSLFLFFFLLPLINSTPDLFFTGYPYNYMGIPLFYISGFFIAFLIKREKFSFKFKWIKPYLFLLGVLFISTFFTFFRWSNLTLSTLSFMKDTPVAPSGVRVSFASIFPVITLFLFAVSPLIFLFIKKHNLRDVRVFRSVLYGYTLSVLIGLYQWLINPDFLAQKWWGVELKQFNAGFSDFNGFGLFSGVLFLYLVITIIRLVNEKDFTLSVIPEVIFLFITFTGIFLSGSRTAFIFVIASVFYFLFTKKIRIKYKLIPILVVIIILLISSGTLKKRINQTIKNFQDLKQSENLLIALDRVTNGRIIMVKNSWHMVKKYPITGVGAGNFIFFLKHLHFGEEFLEDLSLNEYLLILSETGIIGLLTFIFFLIMLLKPPRNSQYFLILLFLIIILLINNFFWLPETFILFWIVVSFNTGEQSVGKSKNKFFYKQLLIFCLLIYFVFNLVHFSSLHPKNLVFKKGGTYDYGLWYQEESEKGKFRWSKGASGIYLKKFRTKQFALSCEAPLSHMKGKKQEVKVYWQGKLYRRIVFKSNTSKELNIKDMDEGFLELRVYPTFNLKKMGLGPETRDLGVQLFLK